MDDKFMVKIQVITILTMLNNSITVKYLINKQRYTTQVRDFVNVIVIAVKVT